MKAVQWFFLVSLLLMGIDAGIFVGAQIGQVSVQAAADAAHFIWLKQQLEFAFGSIMPILVIPAAVLPIPLLFLLGDRRSAPYWLVAVSVALWVAAIVVTLVINEPVNVQSRLWDLSQPPVADWAELRARWHLGQGIRTVLTTSGFASLLISVLLSSNANSRN